MKKLSQIFSPDFFPKIYRFFSNGKIGFRGPLATMTVLIFSMMIMGLMGCSKNNLNAAEPVVSETTPAVVEEETEKPAPHPFGVPGMRTREYEAKDLTLLDPVPAEAGLAAREFSYISDGFKVYGLIEMPAGEPPEGGWPVIVLSHGYIHPSYYSTVNSYRRVTRYYARKGFIVVKPDYRGHGRSEGYSDMTASWIFDYTVDTLNLLAGIDKIPGADSDNVFLYGHSMGGEIALRVMMIDPKAVKGVTLWAAMSEDFPENLMFYVGQTPAEREAYQKTLDEKLSRDLYPELSLSPYIDSIKTPMIIHHGTADDSVPLEWTTNLRAMFDKAGIKYTYYEYPGEDHNISLSMPRVMDRDMEFFRSLM